MFFFFSFDTMEGEGEGCCRRRTGKRRPPKVERVYRQFVTVDRVRGIVKMMARVNNRLLSRTRPSIKLKKIKINK